MEDVDDKNDDFYKRADNLKNTKISALRPMSSLTGKRPISGVQAGPD